ncbi:hypothetical protein B0T20DRAFT_451982 [Sordaria brevicollis]|uniref:Rhodopsin domain-containing protein n=1 Tax=Sordaria brevicollis TaxID=83679 RepID=A0AAE0PH78_SORBR|nr:hypothetical protein B0T20DRAFT_451982 [Sordaria brevicollis]
MDRGAQLMGVDLALWSIALIAVALRAYTRLWVRRDCFGPDDILMFISMACFTIYIGLALAGIQHGSLQWNDEDKEESIEAKIFRWACYHAYTVTITFTRLSVSWFLLRLASINRIHRHIVHGAIIMTVCNGITFIIFTIFQCNPVHFYWDQRGNGRCVDKRVFVAVGATCSILNVVTDLIYALLPAWIIYHLKIKLRTRIALIILMGMGCLASCAVVIRMVYIKEQDTLKEQDNNSNPRFLFLTHNVALWSTAELFLAITAASLATLRPLIIKVGRKLGVASAMSESAQSIEFGPLGPPPALIREQRKNSFFSRRGPLMASNAVLLETERTVPFEGAHVSFRHPGGTGFSRHIIVTRSSHKDPNLTDSTMPSWPPKT